MQRGNEDRIKLGTQVYFLNLLGTEFPLRVSLADLVPLNDYDDNFFV